MSTATQQFDIALNILSVAAARLQTIQPSHLGLDVSLNFTLTTKYWLLRIRLVSFLSLLNTIMKQN